MAIDLGLDEAVDGFWADDGTAVPAGEEAADLLGRPASGEAGKDVVAQGFVPLEARAGPPAGLGLLLGVGGPVADLPAGVALQLARDGRWRAIQICSDLADRAAFGVKAGNGVPVIERELVVAASHGNTVSWCCTSFANSRDP